MVGFAVYTITSMIHVAGLYYLNEKKLSDLSYGMPPTDQVANSSKTKRIHFQQYTLQSDLSSTSAGKNATSSTVIVAFANRTEQDLAVEWYRWLEELRYTEHTLVALDEESSTLFQSWKVQHDLYVVPRFAPCDAKGSSDASTTAIYDKRRKAIQWKYVYSHFRAGRHVLLTNVHILFARYESMVKLEQSEDTIDMFFSYAQKYPMVTYNDIGFTL